MEEEKKEIRISFTKVLLIIGILLIVIAVMGITIYRLINDKKEVEDDPAALQSRFRFADSNIVLEVKTAEPANQLSLSNTIVESEKTDDSTSDDMVLDSNLRKIDILNERTNPKYYTYKDTKLDYNIFYYGVPISENVGVHSIGGDDGFEKTGDNMKRFDKTYYT